MDIVLVICCLLIPVIMIIGGYLMKVKTPKKINGIYGYRTERSMKNKETWNFANKLCGDIWLKTGLIMLIISAIITAIGSINENVFAVASIVILVVQTIVLIVTIVPVEKALGNKFDEDGNPKEKQ